MKKASVKVLFWPIVKSGRLLSHSRFYLMPKTHTKSVKQTSPAHEQGARQGTVREVGGRVAIHILAKPGAKDNNITGITEEGVGIQIAAPPVDGEANTELVKYVSKVLGLRKSDVNLDKGSRSRNKTLVVTGISREDVLKMLHSEIQK